MKKRIESLSNLQKPQKYFYKANAFDNKKEKHLKHQNNHKGNTIHKAKDEDPVRRNKREGETHEELIKQINSPHLKELRLLVCSLINSADRLGTLTISEENYVLHYQRDRKKLIDYFNSLVVKQIDLTPSKNLAKQRTHLLSPEEEKHIIQEVAEIKINIQTAIAKKRSKSSLADLQNDLRRQVSLVKAKVKKLQETQCMNQESELGAFIKQAAKVKPDLKSKTNLQSTEFLQDYQSKDLESYERKLQALKSQMCIQSKQKEKILATLAYVEVLIFKSKHILSEVIDYGEVGILKKLQKEYIQVTILALDEGLQQCRYNQAKNDALLKLKQEAQSTIKSLCQCRKRVFLLLREKEDLQKKLNEQKQAHTQQEGYYEELQAKINKLNCEMGEFVHEVEKKEELVQYLKGESQNLKEDIRSLEQMLNQSRLHYQGLTHELTDSGQKLRAAEEQLNELMNEMQGRNRQLISKLQEIQKRDEQIHSLKLEISNKEQQASLALKISSQQKMLIQFSRQQAEIELKQHKHTIKFLSQQRAILQQKIQQVLTHEQDLKMRIATLQQQFQLLEKQNEQLYKDIRSYQHSQSSSQETVEQLVQSNRLLNQQVSALKSEIIEYHQKIKFYQQKLVELAALADTIEFEVIIQNQQNKISQLEQRIQELEHSQKFKERDNVIDQQIQSLSNQINSTPEIHSESKISPLQTPQNQQDHLEQQQKQCHQAVKTMQQGLQKCEQDKSNNLLRIDDDLLAAGGSSVLSLYEIKVINEKLDTVDTHKALHLKQKPKQKFAAQQQYCLSDEKQPNNAIFLESKQVDHQIQRVSEKQITPKCSSQSSNKVNLDFEFTNREKQIVDLDSSQRKKNIDISNSIKRMPDLLMADSTIEDQKKFNNLMDQLQVMQQSQVQGKKESHQKSAQLNSRKTVARPRNIYIMLGKNQTGGNRKGDSNYRSKSCFQVQM